MDKWLKYFSLEEVASFKNAENLYGKAYLICEKVFDGKKHSSGVPYINHLVKLADGFADEKAKVIALLHDIMKETDLTEADLNYIGFPSDIVKTVVLMARQPEESYDEFITRIIDSKNGMALQIKKTDLEINMDLESFENVSDEFLNQTDIKYKPQYEKILNHLEETEGE